MNFFPDFAPKLIPENSDVCRFFNQICENKSEICRKFWILWKLFTIIQNYSLHSLLATQIRREAGVIAALHPIRFLHTDTPAGTRVFDGEPKAEGPGLHLSWKVRYRAILWFFRQMSKLYRARSRLYRRRFLQVNTRWKALDEIYKIYMLLHRSDLYIPAKI